MAVTRDQLAYDLRISTGEPIPDDDPEAVSLDRSLGAGAAIVATVAGPATPEAIRDMATLMVAKYMHDSPASPERTNWAFPARNSGALALLAPWRKHRALPFEGTVDGDGDAGFAFPPPPAAGDVAEDYRLRVGADGTVSWVAAAASSLPAPPADEGQYGLDVAEDSAASWDAIVGSLTYTLVATRTNNDTLTIAADAPSGYSSTAHNLLKIADHVTRAIIAWQLRFYPTAGSGQPRYGFLPYRLSSSVFLSSGSGLRIRYNQTDGGLVFTGPFSALNVVEVYEVT